jgi:hypothetical protein
VLPVEVQTFRKIRTTDASILRVKLTNGNTTKISTTFSTIIDLGQIDQSRVDSELIVDLD